MHVDRAALQQAVSDQAAPASLEDLYRTRLDSGAHNCMPLSLALITAARQRIADGDSGAALICAEYARRLSPDYPQPLIYEYYVRWQANRLMVHNLILGAALGYFTILKTLNEAALYAFTQLAVVGTAFLLTMAGLGLLCLVRNIRLLIHDLQHAFADVLPIHFSIALAALLCVLPLLLGLAFTWLFPYWLMLFWGYYNRRERAVFGTCTVVFAAVIPLIAAVSAYVLFIPQSGVIQRLWQANYGCYTRVDIDILEQETLRTPDDYELVFSAGLVNKRLQNYATALSYYNRLLASYPGDYKASVNAGNVYLATGDWDSAVTYYRAAAAAYPDKSAAAHFNLARAYQQRFMFTDAETHLSNAKQLDSARVDAALQIYSENYNRLVIDETIPRLELWRRGFSEFSQQPHLITSVWNMALQGLNLPMGPIVVMVVLIVNLLFASRDPLRIAMTCTMCGKAMCRRCQRSVSYEMTCLQCLNFIKKQDQLSIRQKNDKKVQIAAYLRRLRRWTSLFSKLFPGMGHVWKGRCILGTVFTFIFFVLLCKVLAALFFKGPWHDAVDDTTVYVAVYGLLAAGVWYGLQVHVRTMKKKSAEDNAAFMGIGFDA